MSQLPGEGVSYFLCYFVHGLLSKKETRDHSQKQTTGLTGSKYSNPTMWYYLSSIVSRPPELRWQYLEDLM